MTMSSPAGGPGPRTEELPVVRQQAESLFNQESTASIGAKTQKFARKSSRSVRLLVAVTAGTVFIGVCTLFSFPGETDLRRGLLIALFIVGVIGTRKALASYRANREQLVACKLALARIAESNPIDDRPDDTWRLGR